METKKNYVILKKTYFAGRLDKNEIIGIYDNRLDAYLNLLRSFESLKKSYVVNYKEVVKDRIVFMQVRDKPVGGREVIEFSIPYGAPNDSFCLYNKCDMSDLLNAMMNLELFKD